MNWKDLAEEMEARKLLNLNPKEDMAVYKLKQPGDLLNFLRLIRSLDFDIRILHMNKNGINCYGVEKRLEILNEHIKILENKK